MKSYEERADALFKRREEYLKKRKKARKVFVGAVAPVLCICLVGAMGLGLYQKSDKPPIHETEQSDNLDESGDGEASDTQGGDFERLPDNVLWSDIETLNVLHAYGFVPKYNFAMIGQLYVEIEKMDSDQVIAVCVGAGPFSLEEKEKYILRGDDMTFFGDEFDDYYAVREEFVDLGLWAIDQTAKKGRSWTELAKSPEIIDKFYELFDGKYGWDNYLSRRAEYLQGWYKEQRATLEGLGFNVIYDGSDIAWGKYLIYTSYVQSCVILTTPGELKAFGEKYSGIYDSGSFRFSLAPENPEIALKHVVFDDLLNHVPSKHWLKAYGVQVEGYNGNVDEFYKLVLEERAQKNKQK